MNESQEVAHLPGVPSAKDRPSSSVGIWLLIGLLACALIGALILWRAEQRKVGALQIQVRDLNQRVASLSDLEAQARRQRGERLQELGIRRITRANNMAMLLGQANVLQRRIDEKEAKYAKLQQRLANDQEFMDLMRRGMPYFGGPTIPDPDPAVGSASDLELLGREITRLNVERELILKAYAELAASKPE